MTRKADLPQPARRASPWPRWGALALLLVSEILLLSVRFDTGSLNDVSGEWALAVGMSPRLMRLAIVAVLVGVVLHARALADQLRIARAHLTAARGWPWFLVLHLLALSAFAWLTAELLEHGRAAGTPAAAWVLGWVASGALSMATWGLAVLPGQVWGQLARIACPGLAVGLGVGVAVWVSELMAVGLWQPLARGTLWCAGGLLELVYPDVIYQSSDLLLATPAFAVRVDPDCSGYEGIALIVAFLGVYLWFDREALRMPQALLLLPLGAAVSWSANVLRTALLVAIGSSWSRTIAMGGFHSQAGAIAFSSIGLALVVVARRSAWFARSPGVAQEGGSNPTAAYLAPLLSVIAAGMLTSAFSHGLDALYPVRVGAGLGALWCFRRCYRRQLAERRPELSNLSRLARMIPAFALGAATFAIWVLLAPGETSTGPGAALALWPAAWRTVWWGSRLVGYLFVAPVVEELAFRGFLIRRVAAVDFEAVSPRQCSWRAIGVSAFAFGALHGSHWAAGTLAGLAYGFAYRRRGRLADAVAAHFVTNASLLAYVIASGNWSLLS